jgi:hypothetical protein
MAVTQEQIDAAQASVAALNQAIDDGVRQVSVRGQTTTYNTTDSLIRARNDADLRLKALLAEFEGSPRVSGRIQYLYQADRGYD